MARQAGQPEGTYRITSHQSGKKGSGRTYVIRLPAEIGSAVPSGTLFKPRFVEDGILFERYVEETPDVRIPTWVKERRS